VLKYLLTAFDSGEDSDSATAHELLGRGLSALHELSFLRLDPLVDAQVLLALENNPEPLKLTFDESGVELLSKIMQGSDERYRLSVAFQIRPVMIVPAQLPRGSLLVGIDYTTTPRTVIGPDGVQITVLPSLGPRLERVEPERFEVGVTLTIRGDDLMESDLEVVLGNVMLDVVERRPDRLTAIAEGSPGTPIAVGGRDAAGREAPPLCHPHAYQQPADGTPAAAGDRGVAWRRHAHDHRPPSRQRHRRRDSAAVSR